MYVLLAKAILIAIFDEALRGIDHENASTGTRAFFVEHHDTYLFTFRDSGGERLSGERSYSVHIPAKVPAKQYWSMIVYAVDTAALIRDAPVVTLDSYNQAMRRNADGSVDIYFGPKAPAGKEPNWIYTAPGKAFFPAMRFYDPDKPLFDRTWKLSDIEHVSAQ